MKHLITSILFLGISLGIVAQSEQLNLNWLVPTGNSGLLAIASDPVHGKTYIGGNFTHLQHQTPYNATVDLATGLPNSLKVQINDEILAAVPDGNGGFFIGGKFTKVNGQPRSYLAHIDQNNNLTAFNVQVNYVISCLELHSGTLYFGGHFGSVNGTPRLGAAAVDATTGALLSWNPSVNDIPTTMIADGTRVLMGGYFTTVGGTGRNYLCSVDATTGALNSWNPNSDNPIIKLETNGTDIYALGGFNYMSGQYKNRICRFNSTTLALDSWTLGYSPGVPCGILFEGTTMYLYGSGLKVYDLATSTTIAQIGSDNQIVSGVNIGGMLWFGGDFTTVNGNPAQYLFRYNTATSAIESWDALPDGYVHGVVHSGSSLLLYGNFSKYGQTPASNLVVYETATGQPAASQISIDGPVDQISIQEHFLVLRGLFSEINGVQKPGFAILDLNTGQLLDFNMGAVWMGDNYRVHNDMLYFTHANGVARVPLYNDDDYQHVLGLGDNNGMGPVFLNDLEFYGDTMIVTGILYYAAGQERHGAAFFDVNTNTLLPLDLGLRNDGWPYTNGWGNEIVFKGDTMYLGGQFDEAFGQTQSNLLAIDMLSGSSTGLNLVTYGGIQSMDIQGDQLTYAGAVTTNGDNRNVFRYDLGTNQYDNSWTPNPNDIVYHIDLLDGTSLFSGGFSTVDSTRLRTLAVFDNCRTSSVTTATVPCNYTWNGTTYTASGYYSKVFQNAQGCDSTASLDLTILNTFSSQTITICDPTYTSGSGAVYDSTGLYAEHLTNIYGCDSLAYLDLEFFPTYEDTFTVVSYEAAYTWPATGQAYSSPGMYHTTLTTQHGCDSTLHLDLSFMPAPENSEVFGDWVADDVVFDVDHDSVHNRMIVTGDFNGFRHRSYDLNLIDEVTGEPSNVLPPLSEDGVISGIVPDGSGGYFVFGSFETIGDSLRNNMAQLDANFDVMAWQSNTTIFPSDIKVRGNYILCHNGSLCFALDKTTGNHLWTISTPGSFYAMELIDGYVYIGGSFSGLYAPDPISRSGMAQVNAATGAVTAWTPNLNPFNAIVYDLHADGNQLYVGGSFTSIVGSSRNRVARLSVSGATTTLASWNPSVNNAVHDIETFGTKVILIGEFTAIGFNSRAGVACINKANTTLHSFNPGASLGGAWTQKCRYLDGKLYFQFYATDVTIAGQTRSYLASFDTVSYALSSWTPNPNDYTPLFVANGNLFASGGPTRLIGYRPRQHVAALDPITLEPIQGWGPAVTGEWAHKATIAGSRLFVNGGDELQVFDLITGASQALPQPMTTNGNYLLDYADGYVYVSNYFYGTFGNPMAAPHGLARIDTTTLDFDPAFDPQVLVWGSPGSVYDIALQDSLLYITGLFDEIAGQPRFGVSSIDLTTMQPTALTATFTNNAPIYQVEIDNDLLYLLGYLEEINGQQRHNLASMDRHTGELTDWAPTGLQSLAGFGTMKSLVLYGNYVFAGGTIQNPVNPVSGVIMASKYSNLPMEFTMESYADVEDLCMVGNRLHAGGLFNQGGSGFLDHYRAYDFCNNESTLNDSTYEIVYNWNGSELNETGTYFQTIEDTVGCDSIVTLHLTFLPPYTYDTVAVSACDSYTWPLNGETYTTSGSYSDTLVFTNGQDSVTVLELTLLSEIETTLTETACDTFFWDVSGITYYSSGLYTDTLLSSAGCDSIVTLDLTILVSTDSTITESACETYTWAQNGTTYTVSGIYTDTIPNAAGCDSIVTLDLTINVPTTDTQTVASAGDYTWPLNGLIYTASGTYSDTIPNAAGCDSVVVLELTIYPSSSVNTFSMPSDTSNCTGAVSMLATGVPDFTFDIGSAPTITSSGYAYFDSLCPGIYSGIVIDGNGDTIPATFVVAVDSNYIYNNPFIDSLALDSLGSTVENCDIYYNSIDSAYIANIFANADTVTVTWAIIDSSGLTTLETTYILGNGPGVYELQLGVFCPQKSTEDVFVITQAIYFDGTEAHLLDIEDHELLQAGIFPNPTNAAVTITLSDPSAELVVYDAQGKLILARTIHSGSQVSLEHVQSGVYFFDLRTQTGRAVKRVVKN